MLKAYDVMTRPLATCAPDTSVTDVAATMRDRDIGDVLIVEEGQLRGIVTDRDLALQALTGQDDPRQTPIHKYMSTKVITGESAWSLEQVAKIMAAASDSPLAHRSGRPGGRHRVARRCRPAADRQT